MFWPGLDDHPKHFDATYVFVKNKIAISNDDSANLNFIIKADPAFLQFSDAPYPYEDEETTWGTSWDDVDIYRVRSTMSVEEFANEWKDELLGFEAWAILDHKGDLIESPTSGPFTQAIRKVARSSFGLICVLFEDDDAKWEDRASEIKDALSGLASPVFYPRFGRVFLIHRPMDYQSIWNRLKRFSKCALFTGVDTDCHPFLNGEWRDQVWTKYPSHAFTGK